LHNGLTSFEYASSHESSQDVYLFPNISFYNLDDDDGSIIAPIINIIQDPINQSLCTEADPSSHYLYALDLQLQGTKSDKI